MDVKKIEENWNHRGFSFGIWNDPPGQVWENYIHDVDELFMMVSGDILLEMKGKVLHLKAGEEVLIPAKVTHTVRNIGKIPSRWLYGYKNN